MTAIAARRRRRTWSALVAGLVVVAVIPVLGIAGWRAIRDSKAARDVTTTSRTIPVTPTALLAGTDADGRLTTLAMLALAPDGAGGSVVAIPVGSSVTGDDGARHRLADRFAEGGIDQLSADVESLMLVALDLAEVVDETQLAALLAPVGDIDVTLPADVVQGDDAPDASGSDEGAGAEGPDDAGQGDDQADDGEAQGEGAGSDEQDTGVGDDTASTTVVPSGDVVAAAGGQRLTPDVAAKVLLASVAGESETERLPANAAVWQAVAATVGGGVPNLAPADPEGAVPPDLTTFTTALWAGPVHPWQMAATPITSATENPTGADLLQTDLAEAIMVVATVAPSAASAVLDGASVQLTTGFTDWHVTRNAIGLLAYVGANVMVVITTDDAPPATSEVLAGSAAVQSLAEEYAAALGAGPVGTVTDPVEGIEVQIVLGQSFADAQAGVEQTPLESVPSRDTIDENLVPTTAPGDDSATTVES